eukprot:TRINITY_DN3509_c0_g1_i12.p1 TRINITY_DN3509_c0_g1~~TRINITY_DN3509_c0_g1_i12.p1  ORF type:complete len:587 (+),score=99.05 TRINITY_DN3509_c0_g1_i12:38-1798(+)
MSPFQLWLHPVHGVRGQPIVGRRIQELETESSVAARLETLTSLCDVLSDAKIVKKDRLIEVFRDSRNLYALDGVAQRTLSMPLSLSQVVERRLDRPDDVLGLISYAQPVDLTPIDASDREMQSSVAWVFVVTYKDSPNAACTREVVLQKCVTELAFSGAIRISPRSFEALHDPMFEGGFGQVRVLSRQRLIEEAHHDCSLNIETFAAKTLSSHVEQEATLAESRHLIAAQGHSNIARFVGLFCRQSTSSVNGEWTIVMEAHMGGTVEQMVMTSGRLEGHLALQITQDVLKGLIHLHSCGIIHRDVKPPNVLRADDGRAVLIDFGLAVHASEEAKRRKRCGTPGFIAPEILRTNPWCEQKSDVFSCGVVLYFALSGSEPFRSRDADSTVLKNAAAKVKYPVDKFAQVRAESMVILKKFLRVSPGRRPDSRRALRLAEEADEDKKFEDLPGALTDGEATTTYEEFTCLSKDDSCADRSAAGSSWQGRSEDGSRAIRIGTSFSEGLTSEDYGTTCTLSRNESPEVEEILPPPPNAGKKQRRITAMRAMMRTVKTAAASAASSVRGLRKTRIDVCPDFSDVVVSSSASSS